MDIYDTIEACASGIQYSTGRKKQMVKILTVCKKALQKRQRAFKSTERLYIHSLFFDREARHLVLYAIYMGKKVPITCEKVQRKYNKIQITCPTFLPENIVYFIRSSLYQPVPDGDPAIRTALTCLQMESLGRVTYRVWRPRQLWRAADREKSAALEAAISRARWALADMDDAIVVKIRKKRSK